MTTLTVEREGLATRARLAFATFSVTGGLASEYMKRGEMIPWSGVIAVEGVETGDNRIIAPDALIWRDLPLPFMFQYENPVGGDGHDGATLTSRIDEILRIDEGRIWARGFIDPTMPDGETMVNAMDKGLVRGVSVDLDKVAQIEVEGPDGTMKTIITSARISGATVCPFQAFMEAEVLLDAELMQLIDEHRGDALVAAGVVFEGNRARVLLPIDPIETMLLESELALVAAAVPLKAHARAIPIDPPADWFTQEPFTEYTPLTITANGRIFGHIAAWGTCHISFANRCVPVPHSNTKYGKFRCGSVLTAEGTTIRTGPVVMDTKHPDIRWRANDAQEFYANTGAAIADVIPYEDEFGIQIAGAVRPDVAPEKLRAFRGSDISPDWRNIDGNPYEMCAMLAVNNSGFKQPDAVLASAGLWSDPGQTVFAVDEYNEVVALIASGPMSMEHVCENCAHADDETVELEDCDCVELTDERLSGFMARFGVKPARVFRKAKKIDVAIPCALLGRSFKRASEFRFAGGDVPRDNEGRWTHGGAGSSGGGAMEGPTGGRGYYVGAPVPAVDHPVGTRIEVGDSSVGLQTGTITGRKRGDADVRTLVTVDFDNGGKRDIVGTTPVRKILNGPKGAVQFDERGREIPLRD